MQVKQQKKVKVLQTLVFIKNQVLVKVCKIFAWSVNFFEIFVRMYIIIENNLTN